MIWTLNVKVVITGNNLAVRSCCSAVTLDGFNHPRLLCRSEIYLKKNIAQIQGFLICSQLTSSSSIGWYLTCQAIRYRLFSVYFLFYLDNIYYFSYLDIFLPWLVNWQFLSLLAFWIYLSLRVIWRYLSSFLTSTGLCWRRELRICSSF